MCALLCFVLAVLASPFKSKIWFEAENAALRHQLIVLRRKVATSPRDVRFTLPAQPVDATQALNLSAGVSNCKVLRGRSLS
jgi:hypothetical protein